MHKYHTISNDYNIIMIKIAIKKDWNIFWQSLNLSSKIITCIWSCIYEGAPPGYYCMGRGILEYQYTGKPGPTTSGLQIPRTREDKGPASNLSHTVNLNIHSRKRWDAADFSRLSYTWDIFAPYIILAWKHNFVRRSEQFFKIKLKT